MNGNVQRDLRNNETLEREGWRVLIIWECETKDLDRIAKVVRRFLGPVSGHSQDVVSPVQ